MPANSPTPPRPAVGVVGPYPPPYGGISVGIQRLARFLGSRGVDFLVYDEAGHEEPAARVVAARGARRLLWRLFARGPRRILHYQSPDWRMRCLVALWGLLTRRRSVISIHGQSFEHSLRGGPLRRSLIRFCLRRTSAVIACNPEIVEQVRALAGPSVRVFHVPAFIPPDPTAPAPELPERLQRFLAARQPVLLWVGWSRLLEGRDLYGLDLTLGLVQRLRGRFPRLGCVLWFSGVEDAAHWERLRAEAERDGLGPFLHEEPGGLPEIHPLFRRADVYLRPTRSDGDSVSVREALALGTPVVASDAAPRPPSCVVFRSGDVEDFTRQVEIVLGDLEAARARARREPPQQNGEKILAIYRELGL